MCVILLLFVLSRSLARTASLPADRLIRAIWKKYSPTNGQNPLICFTLAGVPAGSRYDAALHLGVGYVLSRGHNPGLA